MKPSYSKESSHFYESAFNRGRLPLPNDYYRNQGLKLTGGGEWKSAICPFHADKKPSLGYDWIAEAFAAWHVARMVATCWLFTCSVTTLVLFQQLKP